MTTATPPLDEVQRSAVARLTEREKEALRQWLDHRTAKQIALDLGVSHYAVEKRLRIARAKLGVTTSIEAARMLEVAEGYKRAGAQPPDLAPAAASIKKGVTRNAFLGAFTMTLLATAALALAMQGTSGDDSEPSAFDPSINPDRNMVESTELEIAHVTQTTFHHLDADHSGFLEGTESPFLHVEGPLPIYRREADGTIVPTGETIEQLVEETAAGFYREADKDGDGRISYPEYHQWSAPTVARNGIPAEWQENLVGWLSPQD